MIFEIVELCTLFKFDAKIYKYCWMDVWHFWADRLQDRDSLQLVVQISYPSRSRGLGKLQFNQRIAANPDPT